MKEFIRVDMNEAKTSTEENYYIGTNGLASCTGILMYIEDKKIALVCHADSASGKGIEDDVAIVIYNILQEFKKFKINNKTENIKYLIVQFEKYRSQNVQDFLNLLMVNIKYFFPKLELISNIPDNSIKINLDNDPSLEFVFDANTGKFVTDLFYPNDENYIINEKEEAKLNL